MWPHISKWNNSAMLLTKIIASAGPTKAYMTPFAVDSQQLRTLRIYDHLTKWWNKASRLFRCHLFTSCSSIDNHFFSFGNIFAIKGHTTTNVWTVDEALKTMLNGVTYTRIRQAFKCTYWPRQNAASYRTTHSSQVKFRQFFYCIYLFSNESRKR